MILQFFNFLRKNVQQKIARITMLKKQYTFSYRSKIKLIRQTRTASERTSILNIHRRNPNDTIL